MDKNRIAIANQKFLDALLKGAISPIVKAAYELFNTPIAVVDYAGRCICQMPNRYIGNNSWDTYIDSKTIHLEESLKSQKYYNSNKNPNRNIVYIDDMNFDGAPYLMGQFYDNGVIAGHFGIILLNRVPNESDFEIAELFSKILSSIYSNQINHKYDNLFHYEYILNLLKGELSNKVYEDSNWEMSTILKPDFVVLVSPINEPYTSTSFSHCVCDYLNRNFKGIFPIIYEGNIVTLCCGLSKSSNNNLSGIKEVLDCLESYNYITGISNEFHNIKDVKAYFKQALITVNIGMKINSGKCTHYYGNYTPYQIFFPISELPSPQIWMHPIVLDLQAYDDKYNTEYFKTYREYALSGRDKKLSSKKLNIHLNTLNYRLDKMEDLFKISEISYQDYLHIICSFLLIDLELTI